MQLVCSKEKKMGVGKLKISMDERDHSVHHPLPPSRSCNFMLSPYPSQNKAKQNKKPWSPLCSGWLWMSYLPLKTANRTGVTLLKEIDFPSLISNQIKPSSLARVGASCAHPFFMIKFSLAWACAGVVCASCYCKFLCASAPLYLETLFPWNHPLPLDLILFLLP